MGELHVHIAECVLPFWFLFTLAAGCSSPGGISLNDKTQYSPIIAAGSITNKIQEGTYAMTIDCLLKDSGIDIPANINITGVEKEDGGLCYTSDIVENQKFIVFLSLADGVYIMRYKEDKYTEMSNIIHSACALGVKNEKPTGGTKSDCEKVETRPCPTTTRRAKRTKKPRHKTTTTTTTTTSMAIIKSTERASDTGQSKLHGIGSLDGGPLQGSTPNIHGVGNKGRAARIGPYFNVTSLFMLMSLITFFKDLVL